MKMFLMGSKFDFGDWLQNKLNQHGWSQAEFCRVSGLSTGLVSKTINSGNAPATETLVSISNALKIPIQEVLEAAGYEVKTATPEITGKIREVLLTINGFDETDIQSIIDLAVILRKRKEDSPPQSPHQPLSSGGRKKNPARSVLNKKTE